MLKTHLGWNVARSKIDAMNVCMLEKMIRQSFGLSPKTCYVIILQMSFGNTPGEKQFALIATLIRSNYALVKYF